MISEYLMPVSKKMIQDLIQCEENESGNISKQSKSSDLEFSLGFLFTKGFIGTKKQLREGSVQICTFLTVEGGQLLEKYGLIEQMQSK
jgi:hypothetical protein